MIPYMVEKCFLLPNYPSLEGAYDFTLSTQIAKSIWRKVDTIEEGCIYTHEAEVYYLIVEYWRK